MNALNKLKDGLHFTVDELVVNRGVMVEDLRLDEIDLQDQTFAVHPEGDDALLEHSLQHYGQMDPIVVRKHDGHWQLVDGFRRVRVAQRLHMDRLKARKFDLLSDEDAAMLVLKNIAIELPLPEALGEFAARLYALGASNAAGIVQSYAEQLVVEEPAAEAAELAAEAEPEAADAVEAAEDEEVTLEDLAAQSVQELAGASENLQLLQENWADVGLEQREEVLAQLRYYRDLLAYLDEPAVSEEEEAGAAEADIPADDPSTA